LDRKREGRAMADLAEERAAVRPRTISFQDLPEDMPGCGVPETVPASIAAINRRTSKSRASFGQPLLKRQLHAMRYDEAGSPVFPEDEAELQFKTIEELLRAVRFATKESLKQLASMEFTEEESAILNDDFYSRKSTTRLADEEPSGTEAEKHHSMLATHKLMIAMHITAEEVKEAEMRRRVNQGPLSPTSEPASPFLTASVPSPRPRPSRRQSSRRRPRYRSFDGEIVRPSASRARNKSESLLPTNPSAATGPHQLHLHDGLDARSAVPPSTAERNRRNSLTRAVSLGSFEDVKPVSPGTLLEGYTPREYGAEEGEGSLHLMNRGSAGSSSSMDTTVRPSDLDSLLVPAKLDESKLHEPTRKAQGIVEEDPNDEDEEEGASAEKRKTAVSHMFKLITETPPDSPGISPTQSLSRVGPPGISLEDKLQGYRSPEPPSGTSTPTKSALQSATAALRISENKRKAHSDNQPLVPRTNQGAEDDLSPSSATQRHRNKSSAPHPAACCTVQ